MLAGNIARSSRNIDEDQACCEAVRTDVRHDDLLAVQWMLHRMCADVTDKNPAPRMWSGVEKAGYT